MKVETDADQDRLATHCMDMAGLMRSAYTEGFILGRRVGWSIRAQRTPSEAWEESPAKQVSDSLMSNLSADDIDRIKPCTVEDNS